MDVLIVVDDHHAPDFARAARHSRLTAFFKENQIVGIVLRGIQVHLLHQVGNKLKVSISP
jgi:hypothetical protein